jgi:hypothetical protein
LDILLYRKLNEEGSLRALTAVAAGRLVNTRDTALGIVLGEEGEALLAVMVTENVAVGGGEEAQQLINLCGQEVLGKEELEESQDMLEDSLGDVGSQEEDEEGVDCVRIKSQANH